jgi:putative spermidine/putrescine transport system ATP-binding protein
VTELRTFAHDDGTRLGSLELRAVSKQYGPVTSLQHIDLHVDTGEFITLLGPSGSGKTTLLSIIAGFQRPSAGNVILDGTDITSLPSHRRNIGVVFQNYALFPHMTVWDNIAFPLKRRRVGPEQLKREVWQALAMVQLDALAGRYPRELSGGQQQRVALARATVFHPTLLLMDEPLSALDKNLRRSMQAEIRRIHNNLRSTIVYVTHDQEEALALSDRVALMHSGRIEQVGSPITMYECPATEFAARFIGESNLLHGRVRGILPGAVEVLLADGSVVRGQSNGCLDVEKDVVLVIRPENLCASAPDQCSGRSKIEATIEDIIYLGSSVRVHGRFATGEPCLLFLPRPEVGALSQSGRLHLSWADDAAQVVPKA